jgi:RNase adaptor protein for sRNA GlmZ degradation
MPIRSITFLQENDVQFKAKVRNTEKNKLVQLCIQNLTRKDAPHTLYLDASEAAKYERYSLQNKLQASGLKVVVVGGVNEKTGKNVFVIRRLTDKEWAEYIAAPPAVPAKKK